MILSRSLSLSCASITAEEVPWDHRFHWYRFGLMNEKRPSILLIFLIFLVVPRAEK